MKIFDYNKRKYIIIMLIVLFIGLIIYCIKMYDKESYNDTLTLNETTVKTTEVVFEKNYIDIKGSVKNPGVYEFKKNDRVIDAINMAGGLLKNANTSNINLSQKLVSEMVIYVMNNNEIKKNNSVVSCDTKCKTEVIEVNNCVEDKDLESNEYKININTATVEDFTSLNGIGEAKAKSIIEYRNNNGNFKSIEDIKNISGIGESLYNKIKDNITV